MGAIKSYMHALLRESNDKLSEKNSYSLAYAMFTLAFESFNYFCSTLYTYEGHVQKMLLKREYVH